jgi:hypothetical protein
MKDGIIQYETRMGEPYETSGGRVTPFSKALIFRFPGGHGGLVWNRPTSLLVTREDGQERVVPIIDVTRNILLGLAGAVLACMIVVGLIAGLTRRK